MEFFVGLVVSVIVFLIFREVFCWYWKLNQIVELLEKIEKNTRSVKIENIEILDQSEN